MNRVDPGYDLLVRHAETLRELFGTLNLKAVQQAGEAVKQAVAQQNTVYCAGNGGSAATASHIATDLAWGRREKDQIRPNAVSLAANVPYITALANDAGYENIFVEQLRGPFRPGDVVIGVSASGNSENVLRAVRFANDNGGVSVGLMGFDGGGLQKLAQIAIHVPTPKGAYELVEDVHHAICHMMAAYVKNPAGGGAQGPAQTPDNSST